MSSRKASAPNVNRGQWSWLWGTLLGMDEEAPQPAWRLTWLALAVYSGMVAVALAAAWWWQIPAWGAIAERASAGWTEHLRAVGYGLAATIPLAMLLLIFDRWSPRLLARLKDSVDHEVVPLLAGLSVADFLLISLAAGLGEELFFRGFVQAGLVRLLEHFSLPYPVWLSVAAASVFFGACHWINGQYALAAGLVGVYLGLLFIATGHLLAPITTHAAYDFFALCYLVRYKQRTPA